MTSIIDRIFERIGNYAVSSEHCTECGVEQRPDATTNGLCRSCWGKTPEGQNEHRTHHIEQAINALATVVPPEIAETDIEHPEFNLEAWERFERNHDGELWPWFWSRASGKCKSRMAYLLAVQCLTRDPKQKVAWVDGDQLADACRIRHQYTLGENAMRDARKKIQRCRNADLLVLDDLFKRNWTGKTASDGLWEIIKHRHEWRRLTVITDNIPPDGIENRIHEDHSAFVVRRLVERALEVECD